MDQSLRELQKARLLLSGSYVYAYFMDEVNTYSKNIYEFMQVGRRLWSAVSRGGLARLGWCG